jgi:hypothetical protein
MLGRHSLSFSLGWVLAPIEQGQDGCSLHQTGCRVAEESASGFQSAIDSDVVFWDHVEIARLGRMVGGLFRDIVSPCLVGEVPVAGVDLAKDGIKGLLDTSAQLGQCVFWATKPVRPQLTEVVYASRSGRTSQRQRISWSDRLSRGSGGAFRGGT